VGADGCSEYERTRGSGWRLRRAPTGGPELSAAERGKERAAATVISVDGPAQQGRKEGEGEAERAERKQANGPNGGREGK
jgi:hypothetical protein